MEKGVQAKKDLMEAAIARFGSEAALARACGLAQPTVHLAKVSGKIGPRLAMAIHRVTDGAISQSALRPDLWPPE